VKSSVAIDANVILRYLLADHPEHYQKACALMEQVKSGEIGAFIPQGVLVECVYMLLKLYGVPRDEVADKLAAILSYRGVVNDDKAIMLSALRTFGEKNLDVVDAIVHATSVERVWASFSFDKDVNALKRQ
jgi:predicted nucleic-acid-binding protein